MKQVSAYLSLLLLSVAIFGSSISFFVQREIARAEMKQAIKEEKKQHTTTLQFSEKEYASLHFFERGKELLMDGNMYDVVKKETHEGQIILHVFIDHKETGLLNKFLSFFDEEDAAMDSRMSSLQFFFPEFVWAEAIAIFPPTLQYVSILSWASALCESPFCTSTPPPDTQLA